MVRGRVDRLTATNSKVGGAVIAGATEGERLSGDLVVRLLRAHQSRRRVAGRAGLREMTLGTPASCGVTSGGLDPAASAEAAKGAGAEGAVAAADMFAAIVGNASWASSYAGRPCGVSKVDREG